MPFFFIALNRHLHIFKEAISLGTAPGGCLEGPEVSESSNGGIPETHGFVVLVVLVVIKIYKNILGVL